MKQLLYAKILVIFFHAFIVIVGGHGYGIMGMLDILFPMYLLTGELQFNYDTILIFIAVLCSFFGKILLLSSIFFKHTSKTQRRTIVGVLLLLVSYINVVLVSEEDIKILSILSGIPFLFLMVQIFYLVFLSKTSK
ncbi:hypothetical protein C8N46_107107 [Kordia periserrulae]|uniref:Uncharacterized protein n=1 Tax=Kordia periserrulae TaxID=701523 RepID=A0A2T6BVK8_9FLAO|nr:hypothetical protein [Kordia periserrulae]PTX60101.1 hypothetical protein C8N46_107107 [Kordia periserrulae]